MVRSRLRLILSSLALAVVSLILSPRPVTACPGDCNGDESVAVSELIRSVNVALGKASLEGCGVLDQSGEGDVTIDEVVHAVDASIDGCPAPSINTIAGTGVAGLNEDGLPPLESHLYLPQDVTIGPEGDLYLIDWNNHRIRRIRRGIVETVAGTGELGDARDGIGIYTQFNHPTNVCFDDQGRMIIAAWHNSLVKRMSFPDGLDSLTTAFVENIAGTGARSFSGDGGPGNMAALDLPSSVVVDSAGNIIISDQANYRLRMVEPDGTINTICGTGVPGFGGDGGPALEAQINGPRGQSAPPAGRIAIDDRDRIYIADSGNHRIRLVDRPDGTIHTLAGTGERGFSGDGGPAAEAELDRPFGVEVASNGNVYVADTHNYRVREISGVSSPPAPTPVPTPVVIIPCTDTVGSICTYAGTGATAFNGDGHDRLQTDLYWPFDIEFTALGRRIVLDWNNHLVREIVEDDTFLTLVGTDSVGDGPKDLSDLQPGGADGLTVDLNHPTDVQELTNGDLIFTAWHNHKIREIDVDTGRVFVLLGRGAGRTGDDPLLIADQTLVNQPPHSVLDALGNLFLIDQRNQRIRVLYDFDAQRKNALVRTVAGNPGTPAMPGFNGDGPALETKFSFPTGGNPEPSGGITIDADGVIYFSDTNNHRIRKLEFANSDFTEGAVTTIAGGTLNGEGKPVAGFGGDGGPAIDAILNFPQDLEIGPDGNLYFADANNNRVRMIDLTTGTITTVAGTGEEGYTGDGEQAVNAKLNRPFGVAFDANGDLYVSDTFNSRIRKVKR